MWSFFLYLNLPTLWTCRHGTLGHGCGGLKLLSIRYSPRVLVFHLALLSVKSLQYCLNFSSISPSYRKYSAVAWRRPLEAAESSPRAPLTLKHPGSLNIERIRIDFFNRYFIVNDRKWKYGKGKSTVDIEASGEPEQNCQLLTSNIYLFIIANGRMWKCEGKKT